MVTFKLNRFYILITLLLLVLWVLLLSYSNYVIAATCTITVTSSADSGAGSLRSAINQSNSSGSNQTICFNISSGSINIKPTSPLPAITRTVIIDGTTQPGFVANPIVEIGGENAGSGARGLYITGNAAGSIIRGLVINRFSTHGIFIDTSNVLIAGNYIGLSMSGTVAAPNGDDGIGIYSGTSLANANNNIVGGITVADRNVISGNIKNGIGITASRGGGQPGSGTATGNNILGNYIGTNADGTGAIANGGDGVLINDDITAGGGGNVASNNIGGSTGTTPGGPCTGACNLISGNLVNGIGTWHSRATNTIIKGNYVGTNKDGTGIIANGDIGIEIQDSPNNTIGDGTSNGRNILSGNLGAGLFFTGNASTGNTVAGNYIGTDVTGTAPLPNAKMGVGIGFSPGIQPAHDNIIGTAINKSIGICDGGCNVISGNISNGILLSSTYGNKIVANHVGVNRLNTQFLSNGADGIGFINSPNNIIGSETSNEGNVINGNRDNGIIITGDGSTGNRISGNSLIGNGGAGVMLASGVDNAILMNQTYGNTKLGIDIGYNGISLNDLGDGDAGPNRKQNFPDIYAIKSNGTSSYISGTLNSRPNTTYRIDFYQSDSCNAGKPNNYGQGQIHVGDMNLTTDQFGNKVFNYPTPQALGANKYITSTATKVIGTLPAETSEFSICRLVNTTRPALTNGANWFLKDDLTSGVADKSFGYGFPAYLLMCAWDQNQKGVKLPVVMSNSTWYMRASYTTGTADLTVNYGFTGAIPICGDWDGDGVDTVGVFSNGNWFLRNSNNSGVAEIAFSYGDSTGRPVVGDWGSTGGSGVGVVSTTDSLIWNLRNTPNSGPANHSFSFGGNSGSPVVGDWDGDGRSDIGAYYGGKWDVRTSLSNGGATGQFSFGTPGYTPISW